MYTRCWQGASKNNSQKHGQGGGIKHRSFSPPPSSELRLSAEARNLGEESAGCVYVARGRELLVLFSLREGREGKGREEGREGKGGGILARTPLIRSSGGQETH